MDTHLLKLGGISQGSPNKAAGELPPKFNQLDLLRGLKEPNTMPKLPQV